MSVSTNFVSMILCLYIAQTNAFIMLKDDKPNFKMIIKTANL